MRVRFGVTTLLIVIYILSSNLLASGESSENGFSFLVGTEYQSISQEYYDAIIDTTNFDELEQWELAKDNIEEFSGKTTIQYRFEDSQKRFKIYNDMELSKEKWIGRGDGTLRLGNFSQYAELNGRIEHKSSLDDSDNGDLGYTTLSGYLRGKKDLSEKFSLGVKISGESIFFEEADRAAQDDVMANTGFYNEYDYSLITGRIEGQWRLSDFGRTLDWEIGARKRFVPDSAAAEYNQFQTRLSYNGFTESGYVMFEIGGELKDYAQPSNIDDYFLLNIDSRISYALHPEFELRFGSFLDSYMYREQDVVNRDNVRLRFDLTGQRQIRDWHVGPVVQFEIYSEKELADDDGIEYSDNYVQWELGGKADLLSGSRVFADCSATYGHRGYTGDDVVITSYDLVSLSAMASVTFYRQVSVLLYFDGVFEYHEVKEDNSNLYILSISLTTRF
ncbi:MAG: hypothetical protein R3F48_01805 [Candidatus Zixiibacteriota bacterium]